MFLLPSSSFKVKKTRHKGRACFTTAEIPAGTVIGDYLGKIVSERMLRKLPGLYAFWRSEKESIWPDPESKGLHLVNHSCTPNCFIYPYKGHMLYGSLRKIFPGEEITVSYLLATPEEDEDVDIHICRCGSEHCKATMYATDEFLGRFYNTFFGQRGQSKYLRQTTPFGKMLPPLPSYPTRVKDFKLFDIYGASHKPPLRCEEKTLPSFSEIRKRIRESGRVLKFPTLKLTIEGVTENSIVAKR